MTPQEIKDRLTALGLTQGDLHRQWGESRAVISYLVNRKMRSARLEKKLARKLKVTIEELRALPAPEINRDLEQAGE